MKNDEKTDGNGKPVITVRNVWAGYDDQVVLEDVNLQLNERDFLGLIGPNGGGKTTLIQVILGLITPMRGEVRIMGKPPREGREHIGYVPQQVHLDNSFPISVWDVVRMGRLGRRHLFRRFSSEDNDRVAQALADVDMLEFKDRPIGKLSGGQRQRVYIARALATDPDILILDEPTASIDPTGTISIYEILRKLNETVTILMVSHDMDTVSSYVKTIGCLNRRLHYHNEKLLTSDMLESTYQCPIDLIAHGVPHRVLARHDSEESE